MSTILLGGGTVFDGTGSDPMSGVDVLIEDNKIGAVGPADSMDTPENAQVMDVAGKFVMPGMFNNHSHLGWVGMVSVT